MYHTYLAKNNAPKDDKCKQRETSKNANTTRKERDKERGDKKEWRMTDRENDKKRKREGRNGREMEIWRDEKRMKFCPLVNGSTSNA